MTERTLRGRRFLITGASRGIGRAIADCLHKEGARLALLARKPDDLRLPFAPEVVIAGDLSQTTDADGWVARAAQALGGLDGLVQSAGVVTYEPLLEVSESSLEHQLRVNFVGPFALATAVGRHLRQAGAGGDLLFVGSTLGVRPVPLTAAYAASKAALISLVRSCAIELGPDGIRANGILPGIIDTDMVNVLRPGTRKAGQSEAEALEEQRRALAEFHLLGRLGSPAEVAEAARYLLCSDFVSGSLLTIDGGISLT